MFIPFVENRRQNLTRIGLASLALHLIVVVLVSVYVWLKPEPERPKIHVFEMVQLNELQKPAPKTPPKVSKPKPPEPPPPKPEEPRPVEKKEPEKPIEKKPEEKKPEPPKPLPPTPDPQPVDTPDMALPDKPAPPMDLPSFEAPSGLSALNADYMHDPLLQEYLSQVERRIMSNFSMPEGLDIARGSLSRVVFTIQRSGGVTGIHLKLSSGNGTYDRLAVRAVKVSRLPPLPPFFRAPQLDLVFGFRPQ